MSADIIQPVLSDRYYLDNFNCLVDFVFEHYSQLLSSDEHLFYSQYSALAENQQRLYIRLLSRTGEYVRCNRLSYAELNDIPVILQDLESSELVCAANTDQISDWLHLFTKKELAESLSVPVPAAEITTDLLMTPDLFGATPLDLLMELDKVVKVHHQQAFITFRLLFFGNLHQDLSTFVLRDLGLRRYEPYRIHTSRLPFHSREQIEAYLQYYACTEHYEDAESDGSHALLQLNSLLPAAFKGDPTLQRRADRFSNKIARQLERLDYLPQAAEIYRSNTHPPARERLARIEAKLGNKSTAFELCLQIEADPIDAEEKEFARQFGKRLATKLGVDYQTPDKHTPDEIEVVLPVSNLSVEFAAAIHFAKYGKCYYVENSLITGIFGLAIWDIIFAPVDGAFYHPFQFAPADFYEPDFFKRREELFTQRFEDIQQGQLYKIVLTHFHTKKGTRNPLVHWSHLNRILIAEALKRISTAHWISFFSYMLEDIRNHRSGLPDLIHFPDDGDYILLEVKGPGDRLQKNQLRWMHYFNECAIGHAVVQVAYETNSAPVESQTNSPPELISAGD